MKSIHLLTAILFLIVSLPATGQGNENTLTKLLPTFSKTSKKNISKAEKFLKKGRGYFADADVIDGKIARASESKKKSLKKSSMKLKIKGSEQLGKGNIIIHKALKTELRQKYLKSKDDDMKAEVEILEKNATEAYSKAIKRRNTAKKQTKISNIYKYSVEADDYEFEAIDFQLKALAVLAGLENIEVEKEDVSKGSEEKETIFIESEVVENNEVEHEEEVVVEEMADKNKTESTENIYPLNDPNESESSIINSEEEVNPFEVKETVKTLVKKEEKKFQETIVFKIQIAASKVPLSLAKLRQIYNSDEIINNEKEGIWYKYNIGYFKSYEEAYRFKKRMNVKGSFIVAYRNGVEKVKNIREVADPIE